MISSGAESDSYNDSESLAATILKCILRVVVFPTRLEVKIKDHLRQSVRDNQLLPDCHRLPRCQSFKQHLLFDLKMAGKTE